MANTALFITEAQPLGNKSGGALAQGDVVVIDTANAAAVTTTTTGAYTSTRIGVVIEPNGIANNAVGRIAFSGYVPKLTLNASASLGNMVKTHTVAKQGTSHAAPQVVGDFAEVLGTGTSPAALLFGAINTGGGGGSVAADAIWDAKGDLAVGTGADTAVKLTVGANGKSPVADSAQTAGILWAIPAPQIVTVSASSTDSHSTNNTWEDINSMSVSITPVLASAKLLCEFTVMVKGTSSNWEYIDFRFDLDGASQSETWAINRDSNVAAPAYTWLLHMHTVFESVTAAAHTVKAQWWDGNSSLDVSIFNRRLTVMACQ